MCGLFYVTYTDLESCRQYAQQQQKDMVPLMMEDGYRPTSWLGMLLGTRLWYAFYGSVLESEGAFESKVDEFCRELGERGEEGAKAPVRVTAASTTETLGPNNRQATAAAPLPALSSAAAVTMTDSSGGGVITAQALAMVLNEAREERKLAKEEVRQARQQVKEEMEQLQPRCLISDEQLLALQERLEVLCGAKLLTEQDLFAIEDTVADFVKLRIAVVGVITKEMVYAVGACEPWLAAAASVHKLVELSICFVSNAAFARQLKRELFGGGAATSPTSARERRVQRQGVTTPKG